MTKSERRIEEKRIELIRLSMELAGVKQTRPYDCVIPEIREDIQKVKKEIEDLEQRKE